MSESKFKLYDNDRILLTSQNEVAAEEDRFSYSGYLIRELFVDFVDSIGTYWVSCAARVGDYTVELEYRIKGTESYSVSVGRPLLIQTFAREDRNDPALNESLLSVTIKPGRSPANIETIIYPGGDPFPSLAGAAILALNAGAGVVADANKNIISWQDTRSFTAAPGLFLPIEGAPVLVPSQPDANGKPTIKLGGEGFAQTTAGILQSQDPASLFDFLVTGPFTVAVIYRTDDMAGGKIVHTNTTPGGAGHQFKTQGGFLAFFDMTDDAGVQTAVGQLSNEGTIDHTPGSEHRPKFLSAIIRFDGIDIKLTRLGETLTITPGPLGTAALTALAIGGDPAAPFPSTLEIADFRVWDRALSDEEANAYTSFATTEYGVVQTPDAPMPISARLILRANRGVLPLQEVTGSLPIESWEDSREFMGVIIPGLFTAATDKPLISKSSRWNGHPDISFVDFSELTFQGLASEFEFLHSGTFTVILVYTRFGSALEGTDVSDLLSQVPVFSPSSPGINIHALGNTTLNVTMQTGPAATFLISTILEEAHGFEEEKVATVSYDGTTAPISLIVKTDGEGASKEEPASSSVPLADTVIRPLSMGGHSGLSGGTNNVRLAEVVIYDRLLDSTELAQVQAYMEQRYGIEYLVP